MAWLGLPEVLGCRPRLPQCGVCCLELLVVVPKRIVTIPPAWALATACTTRWAGVSTAVRLEPLWGAYRVTAPQAPLRTAAALPMHTSTAPLTMSVSLPDPRVS